MEEVVVLEFQSLSNRFGERERERAKMKLSLKVQDEHQNPHSHHQGNPLLLRAKVPISVFGFPFLSGAAATVADSSDLSLSLRTSFASGPSLKLSYTPTSTNTVAAAAPLTLTLKSGVSLFGSPQNSPLIISAHFSLSPQNPNPTPSFSLQIKPQLGDFSIRKTTYSSPNPSPNPKANGEVTSLGFVPLERPITLKDFTLDSFSKDSFLSGIAVTAKTSLPLTKRVAMNFRLGVNFPANIEKMLPFLTVNKICIERVDEVKEVEAKSLHSNVDDLELLKCISLSARRELEALQKEKREIKQSLDEMRSGKLQRQGWTYQGHSDGVAKKASNRVAENSGEFEQWKNKKSWGKDNSCKESKENSNRVSDVESELQRAILAASS